jgi:phosphatidylinositol N-acetylglucosaminyltransferase subunit A
MERKSSGNKRKSRSNIRICMVSDFFYPNMGGVETHVWSLAQCLLQRGHKVIVVTHMYDNYQGVRYMTNGLKVYYIPLTVCYDQVILPTLCSFFALFRNILIRERISIVHGHQSTSPLVHECILYSRALGYRACFTDHSLFGFADATSIHVNKVLHMTLSDIDHVICVSNTCRENLVLRAALHPQLVSTIPNAVDSTKFVPDPSHREQHKINVVMLSRLVHRKGIDLAVKVIPAVCSKFQNVHFIVGGDGPKKILLEEMREKYQLHDNVEFLGAVPHHLVRDVLVRGHIFLNCSLTESFCVAILEAASCGLHIVSTNVGGVPEVLPSSMITFADPETNSLVKAVEDAIVLCRQVVPNDLHEKVKGMYSWVDVAKRTERVYNEIMLKKRPQVATRLLRYMSAGPCAGPLLCMIAIFLSTMRAVCDILWPASSIECVPDFFSYVPNHLPYSATRKKLHMDNST